MSDTGLKTQYLSHQTRVKSRSSSLPPCYQNVKLEITKFGGDLTDIGKVAMWPRKAGMFPTKFLMGHVEINQASMPNVEYQKDGGTQ